MAVTDNPVLGTIKCPEPGCGREATVHRAQRGKKRDFYTRCPRCKTDQRVGPVVQERIRRETRWREGVDVGEVLGDWQPEIESSAQPKVEPKTTEPNNRTQPSKSSAGGVLGVMVLVVSGISLFWLSNRSKQA